MRILKAVLLHYTRLSVKRFPFNVLPFVLRLFLQKSLNLDKIQKFKYTIQCQPYKSHIEAF